ncbi:MAG: DUF5312 domain-containing protein [Treponema sp.]|nr:DUF5312 domain-containing protein [Treponema sp.]
MEDETSKSNFDRLVAGLSTDERQNLLRKLNTSNTPVEFSERSREIDKFNGSLKLRLEKESFFYRIILWFRSMFSKKPKEELYNDDILLGLARKINREHPGILDAKNELLDSLFYDTLRNMKEAADFFKPYMLLVNDDPGAFYVFLSSFIVPEIADQINASVDPYNLPPDARPTQELRMELLRKLDDMQKNLKGNSKTDLYAAVQTTAWLSDFSVLPYIHFLAQFTDIRSGIYTCPYKNARVDFDSFSRLFEKTVYVSNEVLESIFLFSQRKEISKTHFDEDVENATRNFLAKAQSSLSAIKTFLSVCPVSLMGKVINKNYDWTCETWGGSEDWFAKYKNQWRKIVDMRWNQWIRDKKKESLEIGLKKDFGLDSFPQIPFRPWAKIWGGVPFACELTGGFLYWLFDEEFDFIMSTLNLLVMEGVFFKNENRTEFSENLNDFYQVGNSMRALYESLDTKGSVGEVFEKMQDSSLRTFQSQQTIETLVTEVENQIRSAIKKVGAALRNMELVFKGIYDDQKDGVHSGLQNINSIRGHDNAKFRDDLRRAREILSQTLYYLRELEPIETK